MISTLRAQDGRHYLTAELDMSVTATRTEADLGAWQDWDVLPDPFGDAAVRVLKSAHGLYLSAYRPDYCDDLGVPHGTVRASAATADIWERWRVSRDGDVVRLQSVDSGLWLSPQNVPPDPLAGGAGVLCNGPDPAAWETLFPSELAAFGGGTHYPADGVGAADPLVGLVRVVGRSFGDDRGPCLVHGCSDFGALAKFHEDRDRMLRQLDVVGQYQQYVRVLWRLNGWYWTPSGITSDPIRDPWFDDALRGYLEACRDRGIRVNLTSGDFNNWSEAQAEESFCRVADIAASVGPDVVWLGAAANELRGVHPDGEGDAAVAQCEALQRMWADRYPGSLRSISDPADQAKDGMQRLSGGNSTVALIHDVRWYTNDALRRCFNTIYENDPGKPVVQDEPTGPNGSPPPGTPYANLVYQPIEDPNELLCIYTMQIITGQASTYFNDPALTSRQPLDSTWGFKELPDLWRQMGIPADIGQGDLKPGHHADAPLQVNGSNAERADAVVRGNYAIGVISGGEGWRVKSGWSGTLTLFGPTGPTLERPIASGEQIPASGPAPVVVRIVR